VKPWLNFICRDEAARVGRMLESVCEKVAGVVAVDTGSEDGTAGLVVAWCADNGLPYSVSTRVFADRGQPFPFADARNYALMRAREKNPERILFLDCDEELVGDIPGDTGDFGVCHHVTKDTGSRGTDLLVMRGDLPGHFTPVTHEAFLPSVEHRQVFISGAHILSHADSARRASGLKNAHDAVMLEKWMQEHPRDSRAAYYLAQTYYALERWEDALATYELRLALGGHPEESWMALYSRAVCLERLGKPRPLVVDAYLSVWSANPERNEPLCALWSYLFGTGGENCPDMAFLELLTQGMRRSEPVEGMYVDPSAYTWRPEFMRGVVRVARGEWALAQAALTRALECELPAEELRVAEGCIRVCKERLGI
jgi:tetratricopeptide (TPR) repeat protein